MTKKIITREQAIDNSVCPCCSSTKISLEPAGCLCRLPNHSCWDYPVCKSCHFTSGHGAGNSNGGIWIPFSKLGKDETYTIETNELD